MRVPIGLRVCDVCVCVCVCVVCPHIHICIYGWHVVVCCTELLHCISSLMCCNETHHWKSDSTISTLGLYNITLTPFHPPLPFTPFHPPLPFTPFHPPLPLTPFPSLHFILLPSFLFSLSLLPFRPLPPLSLSLSFLPIPPSLSGAVGGKGGLVAVAIRPDRPHRAVVIVVTLEWCAGPRTLPASLQRYGGQGEHPPPPTCTISHICIIPYM